MELFKYSNHLIFFKIKLKMIKNINRNLSLKYNDMPEKKLATSCNDRIFKDMIYKNESMKEFYFRIITFQKRLNPF